MASVWHRAVRAVPAPSVQLVGNDQPAAVPPAAPADFVPPAPAPAPDAPAPGAPVVVDTGLQSPPADVPAPAPGDIQNAPVEIHEATTIGYTKKLWEAIQGQGVSGNDALDALAQPSVLG